MPAFSETFHLSPDEFWSLTAEEFRAYNDHAAAAARHQEEVEAQYG